MLTMLVGMCAFIFSPDVNIAQAATEAQPNWVGVDDPVLQGWDLVDSGKHMDWAGGTKYSSNWNLGVSAWNWQVTVIRKDDFWSVKDADVYDYYNNTNESNIAGKTHYAVIGSYIKFNTYKMDQLSYDAKTHVVIHELGHALGLDHYEGQFDPMNSVLNPLAPIPQLTGYDRNAFI